MTVAIASRKPIHETHAVAFDGAVDADGHILEPPDLWETYIDPEFRDRALRIVVDENGLEELEIGGQRSQLSRRGFPATLGAMGAPDLPAMMKDPARTYVGEAPYGSMNPRERIDVLDAEHIDTAILYTTVGLLWEAELDDPPLSQAYTKAYNRWICEFCADEPRLVPTAHLSLSDPAAAAAELERAVGEGARGGYVAPFTHDGRPLGHPDNHPVFAAAQDLDVPLAIHPTFEPQWTKGTRMGAWENVKRLRLLASVQASDGVRHQFTTLFDYGVFDEFPRLKVIVLESGGGWIGYWLDRIDAVYGHTFIGERVPLKHKPSDYFRERVWISCDPDERTIPALAERFGVERFLWASDFPHADHTPEYVEDLNELVGVVPGGRPGEVHRRQRPGPLRDLSPSAARTHSCSRSDSVRLRAKARSLPLVSHEVDRLLTRNSVAVAVEGRPVTGLTAQQRRRSRLANSGAVGKVKAATGARRWCHADHRTPCPRSRGVDRGDAEVVADTVAQTGGPVRPGCRWRRAAQGCPTRGRAGRPLNDVASDRCASSGRRSGPGELRSERARVGPKARRGRHRARDLVDDVARRPDPGAVLGQNPEVVPRTVRQPGHGVRRRRADSVVQRHPTGRAIRRALDQVVGDRRTTVRKTAQSIAA